MFVKADPSSSLVGTRNMTILGRHSNSSIKSCMWGALRSAVVMALFVGCGEQDKGNGHFSLSMYKICLLLFSCLLFLHRAQALPLSHSLAVLAAASPSPSAKCYCLDFLMSKQNHCICFNKITLVVFAPTMFPACISQQAPTTESPTPYCTILPRLPTHLSEWFPVFSPCFTPFCTFKCNLCAVVPSLLHHPQLHISLPALHHQLRGYEDEWEVLGYFMRGNVTNIPIIFFPGQSIAIAIYNSPENTSHCGN